MLKKIIILLLLSILLIPFFIHSDQVNERSTWWKVQSIDTMKISRDQARAKLNDASFAFEINKQVQNIADTGATYIAIDTPYDEEFVPYLQEWVSAARESGLKVWFRGNFSGWEGWFDYPKIDRAEHLRLTQAFILKHKTLFVDGDIFTACPECENGGPGDPRTTGDVAGFRKFLIDEYATTKTAFKNIDKNVISNYASMNGDVARQVMNPSTTLELDGVVTIDHYVSTPEQLAHDIESISKSSGGKIVLGEFGAPIPDINGEMTPDQQADWIDRALSKIAAQNELIGVNYWTNVGSTTSLWQDDLTPKSAVSVVASVYKAPVARGVVRDEAGSPVEGAYITVEDRHFFTDSKGEYALPFFKGFEKVEVDAPEFIGENVTIDPTKVQTITLSLENEGFLFKIRKIIYSSLRLSI